MNSDFPATESPAYFEGQRLTAADLTAAQAFHRRLRWLHNRSLHGGGIVAGLPVTGARGDTELEVGPGFALDRRGRELILEEEVAVSVPPIAEGAPGQPAALSLTIAYDTEPRALEERAGICAAGGAVRLAERPLLRFSAPDQVDPETEVVLAGVLVRDCRLAADLSTAERDEIPRAVRAPRIAAGRTQEGGTQWQAWEIRGAFAGVEASVPTAAAGFESTPTYQARLAGERELDEFVVDGPVVVTDATATSFVLRVLLAGPVGENTGGPVLNPDSIRDGSFPDRAAQELGWHVVWMGVEG